MNNPFKKLARTLAALAMLGGASVAAPTPAAAAASMLQTTGCTGAVVASGPLGVWSVRSGEI
jgi:hypothetical protein